MTDLINKTLADIVNENNSTAKVLNNFHLDFCGQGETPLKTSVAEAGISLDKVLTDLEIAITNEAPDNINFKELSIAELSKVIRNEYHEYLRDKISELTTLSMKVQQESKLEIIDQIHELIISIFNHLAPHMLSEEKVLFPYMEYMEHMVEQDKVARPASFGKVKKTVAAMLDDHKDSTDKLNKLRDLTDDYSCPNDKGSDLQHYYEELRLLDSNLRMHIHIENNVLFKKARVMEEEMLKQVN
jgi:regulator of cell morphogenesis and NO signaling